MTNETKDKLDAIQSGISLAKWAPAAWRTMNWCVFDEERGGGTTLRAVVLIISLICKTLPCGSCNLHAHRHIAKHPIPTRDRAAQQRWVVRLHNIVNARTGARNWTMTEVVEAERARTPEERRADLWAYVFAVAFSLPEPSADPSPTTPSALTLLVSAAALLVPEWKVFLDSTGSNIGDLRAQSVRRLLDMHNAGPGNTPRTLASLVEDFATPGILLSLKLGAHETKRLYTVLKARQEKQRALLEQLREEGRASVGGAAVEVEEEPSGASQAERELASWEHGAQGRALGTRAARAKRRRALFLGFGVLVLVLVVGGVVAAVHAARARQRKLLLVRGNP